MSNNRYREKAKKLFFSIYILNILTKIFTLETNDKNQIHLFGKNHTPVFKQLLQSDHGTPCLNCSPQETGHIVKQFLEDSSCYVSLLETDNTD